MADKRISDLTLLSSADSTDIVPVVDVSANTTKKTTVAGLAAAVGASLPSGSVANTAIAEAAWTSWTPTFTNLSGGTLNYAKYFKIGKTVFFRLKYTFTGANISASGVSFTLPVALSSDYASAYDILSADGACGDVSTTAINFINLSRESSTAVRIFAQNASVSNNAAQNITPTVPFTWTSGDIISISGHYEAA